MPLNVPLSVPGEPNRRYTVHLHRTRWNWTGGGTGRTRITTYHSPAELETGARNGLRMVSECIAAELTDADVELTENPDGSAEAVARVLCTEDMCAAVAEQYRRDADEEIEAEAARAWAATRLVDLTVELLKLRDQVEKPTPGKTPANMLAALLAVQQERTGGATDHIVLMLDEAAHLLRDNDLFTGQSPQGVRQEIDRLIRTGRRPYELATDRQPELQRWADVDVPNMLIVDSGGPNSISAPTTKSPGAHRPHLNRPWTPDPEDIAFMAPEHLVREFERLARKVAEGDTRSVIVARLVHVAGATASRSGEAPRPTCPDRWPNDCEPDGNPAHELLHRIGDRPEIVDVWEARAAGLGSSPVMSLRTLPEALPVDDTAAVLVYREDTPGLELLNAVLTGNDEAIQDARTGLLRWLTAEGK